MTEPEGTPASDNLSKLNWLKKFLAVENLQRPLSPQQSMIVLGLAVIIAASLITFGIRLGTPPTDLPPPPSSVVKPKFDLRLASPADGDVIYDNLITVSGKTLPKTTVFFYTETDENSVESNDQGNFEGTLSLTGGVNTLTVTAFGNNGEEKTISLDLVYDEESVKGAKTDKTPPGQAKKQEAKKQDKPDKAVVGNVDSVTDDTIIVTQKGKQKVKSKVDKDTKIIGQDKKLVKLDSVQPDDVVGVIPKANKIYVKKAAAVKETKRRAIHGVIIGLSEPTLTVAHQIHRERIYVLATNEATVIKIKGVADAAFADLLVGQRIAAVGDWDETGVLQAKRIHIIPGKATGIFERLPVEVPEEVTPSPETTGLPTVSPSPALTPIPTVPLTPSPTVTPSPPIPSPTPTLPE